DGPLQPAVQEEVQDHTDEQIESCHDEESVVQLSEHLAQQQCNTDVEHKHEEAEHQHHAHLGDERGDHLRGGLQGLELREFVGGPTECLCLFKQGLYRLCRVFRWAAHVLNDGCWQMWRP